MARTWKFTDFDLDRQFWENLDCNVIVFGEEVGEKENHLHLQGHVTFKRTYRLPQLKKLRPKVHWEQALCSDYNYELKGENVFIKDNRKQGERSDLKKACTGIMEKKKLRDIAREHPETFVRYGRGLIHLASTLIEPRTEIPNVVVLYGETGVGKSRMARELVTGDYWVWTPARGQWFDGYMGHNSVIFEEFRGQLPFGMLLSLLDRYECPVQYKGGCTEFNARDIVITSPCHPRHWYEKCGHEKTLEQLMRRLVTVSEVTGR